MNRIRVIPVLLLQGRGLVKTRNFRHPVYLGDPRNVVKIFNEKEVDELILLDILASLKGQGPDFDLIGEIAGECFMPVCYGGGITHLEDAQRLFALGIEKVALNSQALKEPQLIEQIASVSGSQSVVVSIDVKRNFYGRPAVYSRHGRKNTHWDPVEFAKRAETAGAGEILLTSIEQEGRGGGYDLDLIRRVAGRVSLPVIAHGGAGSLADFRQAIQAGAAAVAAGSMFVFQGIHRAVLLSYPSAEELEGILAKV